MTAQFWSSLGDAYNEAKRYAESDKAYDKALALEPDNAGTLNNYAYYLSVRDEQLEKAERMSKRSMELAPAAGHLHGHLRLGALPHGKYRRGPHWMEKALAGPATARWCGGGALRRHPLRTRRHRRRHGTVGSARELGGGSEMPWTARSTKGSAWNEAQGHSRPAAQLVLLSSACKSGRPHPASSDRELPARSPEKLLERVMDRAPGHLRYYSAKADVELRAARWQQELQGPDPIVRDSAAWVSVVPALGIEVARVLLTPDSLKMLDKLHDQYFIGDTAAAKAKFGMQPSLSLFQQALLGLPIGLDPNEKYRSDREDGQYVLTSKEKRRFVRAAEDISPGDTLAKDRDMSDRRLERTLRKAEEQEAIVLRYLDRTGQLPRDTRADRRPGTRPDRRCAL